MFQHNIRVYIASKLRHANLFMRLREEYPDIHFTARWPIVASLGSEAQRPVYQWMSESEIEISNSDCVLVYAEAGEILKTALVQVGIAYSRRIPIFVVGEHDSYAEWQFNAELVTRRPSIKRAMESIKIRFRGENRQVGRDVLKQTRGESNG